MTQLLEAAKGAKLNVRDAKEWWGEEREGGARQLAGAAGILENAEWRQSKEDPLEPFRSGNGSSDGLLR